MKREKKGYVVLFECEDGVVETPGKRFMISSGTYAYVGSCGINCVKRIERHLSDSLARKRWHVDYLKSICKPLAVIVLPLQEEELANLLSNPVKGFGSSDCRKHEGHLFRIEGSSLLSLIAHSKI
ncbi:GIY-YIG nuclease family protein [Metallosphaera javensis (ex Sakai et al. 2022)]|uniref:GIY-YIG nuclease family protein n=1 Tax=Metallosphaera javensis (ex Sakai et al. 2022) TaxID=2775498 RepID=UPI002584C6DF|nr:MAG: endonuclease III [Metallosphaera javensis (ex Sakai et al. 2022)]